MNIRKFLCKHGFHWDNQEWLRVPKKAPWRVVAKMRCQYCGRVQYISGPNLEMTISDIEEEFGGKNDNK